MQSVLRNLGAAVLGYVAVAIVSFVLSAIMWLVLGPDGAFRPGSWDTSAGLERGVDRRGRGGRGGGRLRLREGGGGPATASGCWSPCCWWVGRCRWRSTFPRRRERVPQTST